MRLLAAHALLLLAILLAATSESRVSIKIRPYVVMAGQAFWLTCHVPRDASNRLLEYGVVDYRPGSQRSLDGERAPATFQVLVEHVPCNVGPAYCAVLADTGRWTRVEQRFEVAGCN